ncbi:MAG: GxxExxY protein [Saprospiraceae bacterium]
MLHEELTDEIINAFYTVYNTLGFGFLESVYEKAMLIELKNRELKCESQQQIPVYYEKHNVGKFYADIIVEDKVILELKACPLAKEHGLQLYNYLKSTKIEVGLLMSFGKKPVVQRKIFNNDLK